MSSAVQSYPGERLGLPESGPRSIARLPRRIGALAVDYAPAAFLSATFFEYDPLIILAIFAVLQILFIPTIGGSIGHRVFGLRLLRIDGAWTGVWRPIIRTALLVVVIPAVIFDPDQRGLHDKASGLLLVNAR